MRIKKTVCLAGAVLAIAQLAFADVDWTATPAGAKNLLVPGRALDCTREAYGALRVMVNCNQMGEAAGLAAAKKVLMKI